MTLGAVKIGKKQQVDQYFNPPHDDFRGTKKYIRLRIENGKGIFAYHENLEKSLTKEIETAVENPQSLNELLESLGFQKLGLIDKKREKFKMGEFYICLDVVKGIGTFVEIETDGNEDDWEKKRAECISLLKKLGLDESFLTDEYLCDIATRK